MVVCGGERKGHGDWERKVVRGGARWSRERGVRRGRLWCAMGESTERERSERILGILGEMARHFFLRVLVTNYC